MFKNGNVTIMVTDLERAVRFYRDALGLSLTFHAGDEWAQLTAPGLTIGLHPRRAASPAGGSGGVSLGFEVDHLEAAMAALQAKGVHFDPEIKDDHGVRIASFADPDGTPLYIAQVARASGPDRWH
jgi:catechol 2,3-dioxygenase-like lactoylglutathione lyase family enzyme